MTHVSLGAARAVRTRHLFDAAAVTQAPLRTATHLGVRSTNLIKEGTVTGERINGRMVPGGGDWMLFDSQGVARIDVRYAIETDDGAIVQVSYNGRLVFNGDALQRLRAGEQLHDDDYYFRTAPTFEAPASYDWLNRILAVGIGTLEPAADTTTVRYTVYELL